LQKLWKRVEYPQIRVSRGRRKILTGTSEKQPPFVAQACAGDILECVLKETTPAANVELRVLDILENVHRSQWKFVLDYVLRGAVACNVHLPTLGTALRPLRLLDPENYFPHQEMFDACMAPEMGYARLIKVTTCMQMVVHGL
jgi:hypothetical protein